MDSRRRSLERAALSSGSPDDEARVLLERLRAEPPCKECGGRGRTYVEDRDAARAALTRPTTAEEMRRTIDAVNAGLFVTPKPCSSCAGTGSILRARVECAAWAGSEAAKLVTNDYMGPAYAADCSLPEWLSGLSRWGGVVVCLAATAAADAAYQADEPCSFSGCEGGECQACDFAWKTIEAARAWIACQSDETEDRFLTASASVHNETVPESHRYAWLPTGPWAYDPQHAHNREAPLHAARIAGEPAVREAAAAAVRAWALGGEA